MLQLVGPVFDIEQVSIDPTTSNNKESEPARTFPITIFLSAPFSFRLHEYHHYPSSYFPEWGQLSLSSWRKKSENEGFQISELSPTLRNDIRTLPPLCSHLISISMDTNR